MNKVKPAQLHEYPEYLPSGETRIRAIPEHWDVSKLKHCLKVNESTLPETTDPDAEFRYIEIGAVESGDLTEPPRKIQFGTAPSRARRMVKPGDTIVSTVRTYLKAVWYADDPGDDLICSTGFAVLTPREGTIPKFASYVALSAPFTDQVTAESVGIAYPAISEKKLSDLTIMLPPPDEQAAIVRYLDHADAQIQYYIAGKERLIALLEEQRQALVHQAVTRGLDPSVRLKPSGVEWLGDVPEHWRIGPLKRAFVSMDYGISESASDSGTIHLLTMGNLRDGQVIVPHEGGVDSVDEYLLLREGDLLFNRTNSRELVGKVGLFAGHDSPTTFASYLVRMRPLPDQEPEYLNMALNDASFISHARRESVPSLHQSNLNPTRYGRIHIALPPKDEQDAILRTLQKETATLRDSVIQTRRQIDLMNEYRTRLISDVVTGQIDVR